MPIGRNPLSRGVVVSIGGFSWVFPGSTPKCIHVKKHKNAWTYAQTQWKPRNPKPSKLLWLCSRWLACRTLKPEMWVEISTGVERLIDVSATLEPISVFRQTFNGNTAWLGAYTSCAEAKNSITGYLLPKIAAIAVSDPPIVVPFISCDSERLGFLWIE